MFDSGATTSVIGSTGVPVLNKFKLKINNDFLRIVGTADETEKEVKGTVDLPVCIGNKYKIIKCLVVPSLPQDLFLVVILTRNSKL